MYRGTGVGGTIHGRGPRWGAHGADRGMHGARLGAAGAHTGHDGAPLQGSGHAGEGMWGSRRTGGGSVDEVGRGRGGYADRVRPRGGADVDWVAVGRRPTRTGRPREEEVANEGRPRERKGGGLGHVLITCCESVSRLEALALYI